MNARLVFVEHQKELETILNALQVVRGVSATMAVDGQKIPGTSRQHFIGVRAVERALTVSRQLVRPGAHFPRAQLREHLRYLGPQRTVHELTYLERGVEAVHSAPVLPDTKKIAVDRAYSVLTSGRWQGALWAIIPNTPSVALPRAFAMNSLGFAFAYTACVDEFLRYERPRRKR